MKLNDNRKLMNSGNDVIVNEWNFFLLSTNYSLSLSFSFFLSHSLPAVYAVKLSINKRLSFEALFEAKKFRWKFSFFFGIHVWCCMLPSLIFVGRYWWAGWDHQLNC